MNEEQLNELIQLIDHHYTQGGQNKAEEWKTLDRYASRLDFLPVTYQILQIRPIVHQRQFFAFMAMRQIIERRGCLQNPQQLFDHLKFIFQTLIDNSEALANQLSIAQQAASAAAICMRQLLEKGQAPDGFMENLMAIYNSSPSGQLISLKVIDAFVNVMSQKFRYIDILKENNNLKLFQNTVLDKLIPTALQSLGNDPNISEAALKIISSGLRNIAEENGNNKFINYPMSFQPFYADQSFISLIVAQINTKVPNIVTEAFNVLDFYLRAGSTMWPQSNRIEFFSFVASQLKDAIMGIPLDDNYIQHVCSTIGHIFNQLTDERIVLDATWQEFINFCAQFTMQIFQAHISHISTAIKIWFYISDFQISADTIGAISQMIFEVLKNIVVAAFVQIENSADIEETLDDITAAFTDGDLVHIWEVTKYCHQEFSSFLFEVWDSKVSEATSANCTQTTLIQLRFLILLFTARFEGIKILIPKTTHINYGEVEDMSLTKIGELVLATNSSVEAYANAIGKPAIEFESSLVSFCNEILTRHFSDTKYDAEEKYIQIVTTLFDRIFYDLSLFSESDLAYSLLDQILTLVYTHFSKKQAMKLFSANSFVQQIFTRTINIEFEGITDPSKHSYLRTKLHQLYSKLITTWHDFLQYLNEFENEFKEIVKDPTAIAVLNIYSDLKGAIIGFTVDKNTKSRFIDRFINWISDGYVDITTQLINSAVTDPSLVEVLVDFWTEAIKNASSFESTGTGIILFQAASKISNAVLENVASDASNDLRSRQMEILIKLAHIALTSKIANFGLMKHYGDPSVYQLTAIFFDGIMELEYPILKASDNLMLVLKTCLAICQNFAEDLFSSEERVMKVLNLTAASLDDVSKDTWQVTCDIVKALFISAAEARNSNLIIAFRRHITYIISSIITTNGIFTFSSTELILMMNEVDENFIKEAFANLVAAFEPQFHEPIQAAIVAFMTSNDPIAVRTQNFNYVMKRFPATFVDIPFFAAYY